MDTHKFGSSVRRIVVVGAEGTEPAEIYRTKPKNKKGSNGVRLLGKAVHGAMGAQRRFADRYETAHDRSNGKKKDGWLLDLPSNFGKAARKALRKMMKDL